VRRNASIVAPIHAAVLYPEVTAAADVSPNGGPDARSTRVARLYDPAGSMNPLERKCYHISATARAKKESPY
jgi:hypothetical protein